MLPAEVPSLARWLEVTVLSLIYATYTSTNPLYNTLVRNPLTVCMAMSLDINFDPRTFDPRDQIPCLSVTREFGPGGTKFPRKFDPEDHISRGIGSLSGDLFLLLPRPNFLGNVVPGEHIS